MKLPVNKKWWQFWLPRYVDVAEEVIKGATLPSAVDCTLNSSAFQKGRVVKAATPPDYDPDQPATGGRIVRVMPKQLKKIKEGQESNERAD